MPITLPKFRIHYTPAPKVACSSLKSWFFHLENGRPFENMVRNGGVFHIHNYYSTTPFRKLAHGDSERFWKFAVVRDPVRRLISCYSNRVVYYNELSDRHLSPEKVKSGANPSPSLEEFIEKLEIYMDASDSIKHHASPLVYFLGDMASYYDRVFKIEELPLLEDELNGRTGGAIKIPHEQAGGPKIDAASLSTNSLDKIRAIYKADYDVFF